MVVVVLLTKEVSYQGNSNAPAFDNFSACARFTNSSGSNTNTDIQVSHTDYITFNDNPNVLLEPPKVRIQLVEFY